ncbi:hypothetical protein NQ318_007563 [Aromia moschata]|uniref:Transposase n=1 Tax=Aromia moschata TaxID=1265417 RepID=A0AAV8YG57_9CUCU|nr:hypothetical protein NQ318_007563 [Aromia moschata]
MSDVEPDLSIDEQMVPFRGHFSIKHYVTGNPHPLGKVIGKPEIVMDYNCTKGVDTVDQLCAYYNYAPINSEIIFHGNNPKDNTLRRHFLENLYFALMNNHLKARVYSEHIPRIIRSRISENCHIDTEPNRATETKGSGR